MNSSNVSCELLLLKAMMGGDVCVISYLILMFVLVKSTYSPSLHASTPAIKVNYSIHLKP